jgi:hypothetical protein
MNTDDLPLTDHLGRPTSTNEAIRQLQEQVADLAARLEDLDADISLIEVHTGLKPLHED